MTSNNIKIFIDATIFMGMHASANIIRNQSLALMSQLFDTTVFMNYEQVGLCDDYIWTFPREIQDNYYPFMDCLHSKMDIQRNPYNTKELNFINTNEHIKNSNLSCMQSLLISQVLNNEGVLYTHDAKLKSLTWLSSHLGRLENNKITHQTNNEILFSQELDKLYQKSSCLNVDHKKLFR